MSESDAADLLPPLPRGTPAAEHAAELLCAPRALLGLSLDEARRVVDHMRPRLFAAGTTFIREGSESDEGFMVLVLDGEVIVETTDISRPEPHVLRVLGAGHLVGEMSLLAREARSADCRAQTDVLSVVLTRPSLETLVRQNPEVAAKLLLAIASRLAERLRETTRKLRLFAGLTQTMQQELVRSARPLNAPTTPLA